MERAEEIRNKHTLAMKKLENKELKKTKQMEIMKLKLQEAEKQSQKAEK